MKTRLKNSVIFIDSIRDIAERDMIDDFYVKQLMQKLKDLRDTYQCCIIFLNHMPKGSKTYSGAASFKNSIDTTYFVERKSDIKERENVFYHLETEKARIGGNSMDIYLNPKELKVNII
ncbi:hypothetical protein [Campylobacter suis]|uniref:SF4 helicase domain-containing protein n=1 Tax=Campylobacter suis TaxID=2790657 RepID=A0ABM8Q260_9BACT|nr:hypothetical protein [Campylobacter suis]CAD7286891.1 hypothetical protein LMG8286_00592 [Campylobacter suis]